MKQPYPHQTTAIDLCVKRNALISDECGLGKTLIAVRAGLEMRGRGETRPYLVICPKAAVEQWKREILEDDIGACVTILGSGMSEPVLIGRTRPQWIITHYDALLTKTGAILGVLDFGLIVADEAHRIRNRRAKRTQLLKKLHGDMRIALTATPWETSPADMWSILNWLHPKRFTSYWQFHAKYTLSMIGYKGYTKDLGPKNLAGLVNEIGDIWLARRKVDVASHVPAMIMQKVPIRLEPEQSQLYDTIDQGKDLYISINETTEILVANTLARISRLLQVTSDPASVGSTAPSAKAMWIDSFLADNPNERPIIFTAFRDTAERTAHRLGSGVGLIMGGVEADPVIQRFNAGELHAIVATIASLRESISLDAATCAIFIDQVWSHTLMDQAVARIHRITTTTVKMTYFLVGLDKVDELVYDTFTSKKSDIELALAYLRTHGHTWAGDQHAKHTV